MRPKLELCGSVAGRAVDRSGSPLSNATVATFAGGWLIARVASDGRFCLEGVPARPNQTLWVCDDDHARVRLEDICVFPERVVEIGDVPLPDGCRVALRVIDEQGEPIAGAIVIGTTVDSPYLGRDGPPLESVTDEAGRFVTPAWGKHWMAEVEIKAAGHRSVRRGLPRLGPGSLHDLGDVVLPSHPAIIVGRVVDENRQAIEQVIVSERGNPSNATLSAADGSFSLKSWNARASIDARKDGYTALVRSTSRDEEGRDLVLLHRQKWVRVRVTDATGNPVTVSFAAMSRSEDIGDGMSKSSLSVRAWEDCGDGRFRIEYVWPGRHRLTVRATGYLRHSEIVTVPADGSEPDEVTIRLVPGQTPEEAEPRPLVLQRPACLAIWVSLGKEIDCRRGCLTTGRWFPRDWVWCEASELEVDLGSRVRRSSWHSVQCLNGARRWFRPCAADAPLILLGSGAIQGRVADFDPRLAGYLWVVAFHDGPVFAETRVSSDGSFELRDLPAGEYGLRVGDGSLLSLASIPTDAIPYDPWAGAVRVMVQPDAVVSSVELYYQPKPVVREVDRATRAGPRPDWLPTRREKGTYPHAVITIEGYGLQLRPHCIDHDTCEYGVYASEEDASDSFEMASLDLVTNRMHYRSIEGEPAKEARERNKIVRDGVVSFLDDYPEFRDEVRYCWALEYDLPLPNRPTW